MGVDLHRIGTGISSGSSRNGFGNIVSFPSVGFPAAGSYNSTLDNVEYPIAEGGQSVTVLSVAYPNQTCDVDVENNGAGGTYTDWTTATDVQYKGYGHNFATFTTNLYINIVTQCNGTVNVGNGTNDDAYYHDGTGSYYSGGANNYPAAYTNLYSESCTHPEEGMGDITYYYDADGSGGYNQHT